MLLFAAAVAAPPPGVDPDAVDRWADAAQRLLAGPTGCWELAGEVELVLAGYVPASRWTGSGRRDHRFAGTFEGRIEDGRWTRLAYRASAVDGELDLDVPMFPMVGRIDPAVVERLPAPGAAPDADDSSSTVSVEAGSGEAVNTLQRVLDELEPDTATSYAEWSDALGAVKLYEDFPLSDKVRDLVTLTTVFPGGGPPTSLDVVFPKRVKVGDGWPKATLFDAQMHLRGQVVGQDTLPALESVSVGIAVLGFTVGYEQKLTYRTARRCAAAPAAAPATSAG